ncbi:MAG: hypothetical protein ACT7A5_08410 [Ferrovibrionaceae bacterium]
MNVSVVRKRDVDDGTGPRDSDARLATRSAGASLAAKLRLTSRALGCTTSKELCARFAAVNPGTAFTTQNAYKWLGGKAMPRMSSVYDDWARVLGPDVSASFVAAASFDEFAATLIAQFDLPEATVAELRPEAPPSPERRAAPADACWQARPLFVGSYLAVSPAWSRAERGKLILGHAEIADDGQDGLECRYSERLFGRVVTMAGRMVSDGRTAQASLVCSATQRLMFLGLHAPAPPANVIGGMLAGAVLHDVEARTTASRILLLRDHSATQDPLARGRYADASGEIIDQEIGLLGYRPAGDRRPAADHIVAFLMAATEGGIFDIRPDGIAALAGALDRLAPD